MYHYVRPSNEGNFPRLKVLDVVKFERQLKYFKTRFEPITIEELFKALQGHGALPENALLLTFDDGLSDHYRYVFPLLTELKLQGSFFVPTEPLFERAVLDVHKVHHILASQDDVSVIMKAIENEIENHRHNDAVESFESYYSTYAKSSRFDDKETIFIKRVLQHALPASVRSSIVDSLFRTFVNQSEPSLHDELYMNVNQVKEMQKSGMHIGVHGHDHEWWTRMPAGRLADDLARAKACFESFHIDLSPLTASYPYGDVNGEVRDTIHDNGFQIAFTTEVRPAKIDHDDPLLLPRFDTNDFPQ